MRGADATYKATSRIVKNKSLTPYDPVLGGAWHAAAALGAKVKGPRQYWRSLPGSVQPIFGDIRLGIR